MISFCPTSSHTYDYVHHTCRYVVSKAMCHVSDTDTVTPGSTLPQITLRVGFTDRLRYQLHRFLCG